MMDEYVGQLEVSLKRRFGKVMGHYKLYKIYYVGLKTNLSVLIPRRDIDFSNGAIEKYCLRRFVRNIFFLKYNFNQLSK